MNIMEEYIYSNLTPRDKREISARDFLSQEFVPAMLLLFEKSNPEVFKSWNGNACMQTAVFSKTILDLILPNYKWQVKHYEFALRGASATYNHAFLIGINKKRGKKLLVDLDRYPMNKNVFAYIANENDPYARLESYEDQITVREIETINSHIYNSYLETETEFYTNLKGHEIIEKILAQLLGISVMSGKSVNNVRFISDLLRAVEHKYS